MDYPADQEGPHDTGGFHSIGVPSEWGLIGFVEESSGENVGFHSIGVPSEWGPVHN